MAEVDHMGNLGAGGSGHFGTVGSLVARRLVGGVGLLLAASVLIFAGTQILPGDVAQAILGQSATPQAVANLRAELGLDRPAPLRYLDWLSGVLTGDLGTSLTSRQEIADALLPRLSNSLFLAVCAAAISVPLALILGIVAVRYRNGLVDRAISGLALTATSLPEFFLGYVVIFAFAVPRDWMPSPWFPALSVVYDGMPFLDRLHAVALPVTVLTLVVLAHMMRMTRAAILNVMEAPYIETARLKGLTEFQVIRHHALPNAIAPIANVVVLNLAFLLVGVVVVEVIFVYPGMGQYLVDHVAKRDVPVVQAVGLIFATVYIGLNLLADLIAIVANPRLRQPR